MALALVLNDQSYTLVFHLIFFFHLTVTAYNLLVSPQLPSPFICCAFHMHTHKIDFSYHGGYTDHFFYFTYHTKCWNMCNLIHWHLYFCQPEISKGGNSRSDAIKIYHFIWELPGSLWNGVFTLLAGIKSGHGHIGTSSSQETKNILSILKGTALAFNFLSFPWRHDSELFFLTQSCYVDTHFCELLVHLFALLSITFFFEF